MKLTVTGKRMTISEADRADVVARIGHLDRLLNDGAVSATCVVMKERQAHICELTLHARGNHMLHGVGRHRRLATAAAEAVDKVLHQAQRLTDRWKTRRRRSTSSRSEASIVLVESPTVAAPTPRVIRSRGYATKPMTVADAALHLAAGDRQVLVFRDAVSDAFSVLFRRPDGHFGLIEPDA